MAVVALLLFQRSMLQQSQQIFDIHNNLVTLTSLFTLELINFFVVAVTVGVLSPLSSLSFCFAHCTICFNIVSPHVFRCYGIHSSFHKIDYAISSSLDSLCLCLCLRLHFSLFLFFSWLFLIRLSYIISDVAVHFSFFHSSIKRVSVVAVLDVMQL